jgi:Flp pilus assembly protein TadG
MRAARHRHWFAGRNRRAFHRADGAQLLEFALALPVLLMLILGLWDFGSALVLKQKLTGAARETARIVVSTPMGTVINQTNCSATVPCAIVAAATATQQYLENANLDASWIKPSSPSTATACEWIYTSATNPNDKLDIVANAQILPAQGNTLPPPGYLPATQVTLTWPLKWDLEALFPASTFPPSVSAVSTMANLDGGCQL